MKIRQVLLFEVAILAVYLPLVWYLHRTYVPFTPPSGTVAELTSIEKEPESNFAYYGSIPLSQYKGTELLYEDNKPLGPLNSPLDSIRNLGRGRYGLFGKPMFIFSTSDNSDPLTTGRRYWVVGR